MGRRWGVPAGCPAAAGGENSRYAGLDDSTRVDALKTNLSSLLLYQMYSHKLALRPSLIAPSEVVPVGLEAMANASRASLVLVNAGDPPVSSRSAAPGVSIRIRPWEVVMTKSARLAVAVSTTYIVAVSLFVSDSRVMTSLESKPSMTKSFPVSWNASPAAPEPVSTVTLGSAPELS